MEKQIYFISNQLRVGLVLKKGLINNHLIFCVREGSLKGVFTTEHNMFSNLLANAEVE